MVEVDFVASQVFRDGVAFGGGYAALVDEEVLDGGAPADGQVNAKELAGAKAGECQGRFAERLAGQAAGVAGCAAQERLRFDDRDALAEVGGLGRALLSSGSGADDDQIVVLNGGTSRFDGPDDGTYSTSGRAFWRPVLRAASLGAVGVIDGGTAVCSIEASAIPPGRI